MVRPSRNPHPEEEKRHWSWAWHQDRGPSSSSSSSSSSLDSSSSSTSSSSSSSSLDSSSSTSSSSSDSSSFSSSSSSDSSSSSSLDSSFSSTSSSSSDSSSFSSSSSSDSSSSSTSSSSSSDSSSSSSSSDSSSFSSSSSSDSSSSSSSSSDSSSSSSSSSSSEEEEEEEEEEREEEKGSREMKPLLENFEPPYKKPCKDEAEKSLRESTFKSENNELKTIARKWQERWAEERFNTSGLSKCVGEKQELGSGSAGALTDCRKLINNCMEMNQQPETDVTSPDSFERNNAMVTSNMELWSDEIEKIREGMQEMESKFARILEMKNLFDGKNESQQQQSRERSQH